MLSCAAEILASWNGMAMSALARGHQVLSCAVLSLDVGGSVVH